MLMISSGGITWSISDVVEGLVITGTAEDYQAVYYYRQTACEFTMLHVMLGDNMEGDAMLKHITQSTGGQDIHETSGCRTSRGKWS